MSFIDIVYASESAAKVAKKTAEDGVLGSLGINGIQLIEQFINFAVVAFIIWFLILKPITKKLAERQSIIEESLENAKKIEETLRRSEQKYQEKIDLAKVEANKIIKRANAEAEKAGESLKVKAKNDIEMLVDQAKRNIKIERDETVAGIKKSAAEMVVLAVEKILKDRLDEKKDKKLIEESLSQLK